MRTGPIRRFDEKVSLWLRTVAAPRVGTFPLAVLARSGDSVIVFPILILAWRRAGFGAAGALPRALVAAAAATALSGLAKLIFRRSRPAGEWGSVYRKADPHAFPSGHAARTLALAVAVTLGAGPVPGLILIAWSAAVGLSRVALGVHWFLDAAGGWILGFAVGFASGATAAAVIGCLQALR